MVDRLGRLLERFNDPTDKRHRLVSVLAALFFVKIGHGYSMLALPGILPQGAQPPPAANDHTADDNSLLEPLVILPWFQSELTVVPAVAAALPAAAANRKRKRAVQVDGVIKMIEVNDDPEPVPQGETVMERICDFWIASAFFLALSLSLSPLSLTSRRAHAQRSHVSP